MKRVLKLSLIVLSTIVFVLNCKKSDDNVSSNIGGGGNNNSEIKVTTYTPQDITATTAKCGGDVIVVPGLSLTEIGVCWNTEGNPEVNDNHISTEVWNAPFVCTIYNLEQNTKYFVRAYALRGLEYYYGEEKSFVTATANSVPEGAINGLFSVSNIKQVYFSKGNLQYQASTNIWRFAEKQWDFVGDDNSNISSDYNGWIDLYGWGTSGYNHGAVCYQPYSIIPDNECYYAYGSVTSDLNDQTGMADWGYNAISNGGNIINKWRTLTNAEWFYVFNTRNTLSGMRYARATVNNVKGIILLPDTWSYSCYNLNSTNTWNSSFNSNIISQTDWTSKLEAKGAVFMPAAGYRYGNSIRDIGSDCVYWSATCVDGYLSRGILIGDGILDVDYWNSRGDGFSVRLIYSDED